MSSFSAGLSSTSTSRAVHLTGGALQLFHHLLQSRHSSCKRKKTQINFLSYRVKIRETVLPIWWSTLGSIILAICTLSLLIWVGLTFFVDKSPPLNKPLIDPIFLTISANFLYCCKSSLTSPMDVPDPRATRTIRPGCFWNSSVAFKLSNSAKRE